MGSSTLSRVEVRAIQPVKTLRGLTRTAGVHNRRKLSRLNGQRGAGRSAAAQNSVQMDWQRPRRIGFLLWTEWRSLHRPTRPSRTTQPCWRHLICRCALEPPSIEAWFLRLPHPAPADKRSASLARNHREAAFSPAVRRQSLVRLRAFGILPARPPFLILRVDKFSFLMASSTIKERLPPWFFQRDSSGF